MNPTPVALPPSFSSTEFRAALGTFATGVTVITACDESGVRVGLTANSFNSVSLSPPLVLWSLSSRASTMPTFSRGQHYAINVLASDQQHIAERFARKDIDRFEGVTLRWGQRGVPVIEGALAVFECFNRSQYLEGDHIIFVGEVEHCQRRDDAQPLIYHGGRFFTELPL
jgi:flavin reductase (DIM6/NTAB) family NADH-FMN oxidoreductase RutF